MSSLQSSSDRAVIEQCDELFALHPGADSNPPPSDEDEDGEMEMLTMKI
jgi:hypothetical protein